MKVLIVGASIAGPVAAYWLAREGHDVTVLDSSERLRSGGNGVDVRGEAVPVMQRMGLLRKIAERSLDTKGFKFVTQKGDPIVVNLRKLQAEVNYQDYEIPRGDLAQVLFDATEEDVNYRFGNTISHVQQDKEKVLVRFADDSEGTFDVVIGADGLHSQTRRLVFGPEGDYVQFRGCYFAVGSSPSAVGEEGWARFYNRPGRSVFVQAHGSDGDQVNFMFRSAKQIDYNYRDVDTQRELVRRAFADGGWFPDELLAAIDSPDFYFDSISQTKMESWHSGRVVLVGDAAYCASPASGAGALLAITGAYRLAGSLAAEPRNLRSAFESYEHRQRPLVRRQQRGLFTGISVPASGFSIWLRNLVLSSPLAGVLSGLAPAKVPELEEYEFDEASR